MAKIGNDNSYPLKATPVGADTVIGTDSQDSENTKQFSLSGISALANLQSVLDAGNTATENISLTGNLSVTGTVADSSGDVGADGQFLTSTGTGTNWVDSPGGLRNVTVRVGSGDMNNLDTVAVNIIDAPGAGKAIQIVSASIKMDFNATAYSFPAPLQFTVLAGLPQMTVLNTVVNVSTDVFSAVIPIASGFIAENTAVKLTTSAPSATTGDSDVDFDILYRIITV